jgi:hypothetical protein
MEIKLGEAKPGFYKDPSNPSGRAYGSVILVTGRRSTWQPYERSIQWQFIPLDARYRFAAYSEGAVVKLEPVSNKIRFEAIFNR